MYHVLIIMRELLSRDYSLEFEDDSEATKSYEYSSQFEETDSQDSEKVCVLNLGKSSK